MAAAKKAAGKKAPKEGPSAEPAKRPSRSPTPATPKRDPARGPVRKTRVLFPMAFYESHKDEIKAPFKEHELKWTFLGEGKGLYKRADNGVHCFVQFKDDGVHESIWGDDSKRVDAILAAWRKLLGEAGWASATASAEAAAVAEVQQAESEATRLWRVQEPQVRPGEPEFFVKKRHEEWLAKRPTS